MNSVRLNSDGEVEVLDSDGNVKYDEKGQLDTVDNLVRSFLDSNPHFQSATPSTTNTQNSVQGIQQDNLTVGQLDLTDPKHRDIYKKMKQAGKI